MAKTSFVLRALSLLGLEEIINLTAILHAKQVPLKKAAGEDLIVWNDAPKKKSIHQPEEAKILEFPQQPNVKQFEALRDPNMPEPVSEEALKEEDEKSTLVNSDLVLWQREIARESGGAIKKLDAFKGYQKSTQMYVVKSESPEGTKKLRFASTDGILVNKKQA